MPRGTTTYAPGPISTAWSRNSTRKGPFHTMKNSIFLGVVMPRELALHLDDLDLCPFAAAITFGRHCSVNRPNFSSRLIRCIDPSCLAPSFSSPERQCPRRIHRMIEQRLNLLQEAHGVRHPAVAVERRLVDPAGMDVEQPRIARRTKSLDRNASGFAARRPEHIAQRRGYGIGLALTRMEAGKDEQLHGVQPSGVGRPAMRVPACGRGNP